MLSSKCSIVEDEMFKCWWRYTLHFSTAAILLGVRTVFGFSRFGLSLRMPVSFIFLLDKEHTQLTALLLFLIMYAIFAHILQHYHDFQSNVAIFPSVVQALSQTYSFGGRIKLFTCQIRHEQSVTNHEISTSCKKTLDGGPNSLTFLFLRKKESERE